jgi:hypothetical protein
MVSIKGLSKNFIKSLSLNKTKSVGTSATTVDKSSHYQCDCNNDSGFCKLKWESKSICKRMISLLKIRYTPSNAHLKLKEEYNVVRFDTQPSQDTI